MKYLVTGGAGFIGSHIVDRLMQDGNEVIVYDNLSLGTKDNIRHHFKKNNFRFVEADLLDLEKLKEAMKGVDAVFHLAANSDISKGTKYTDWDLKHGTLATYNVLEAMRLNNVKKIVFTSSSAIYGEAKKLPTPEDYGPLFPISLYGASKLACEALISAFCHLYGFKAWIFRIANITGERSTHGVVLDFINKLKKDPKVLEVLGDGKQSKPYLEVKDCVDGILFGFKHAKEQINYFNLGVDDSTDVSTIAKMIVEETGLKDVKIIYTGGDRGWKGDVPKVRYDNTKINKLGWKSKKSSDEAVREAVRVLVEEHRG